MAQKIPTSVVAVVSDALASRYTHAAIDQMMEAAGIEISPLPSGVAVAKGRSWQSALNGATQVLASRAPWDW